MLWATNGTGDGAAGGYTRNEWLYMLRSLFLRNMATMGVAYGYGNALEVTNPSGRDLQVNTGAAIVAGFPYWNTSAVTKTLTLPVIGTTGWRMVLRADWAAQTVRITLKESADGVPTIPSLTQTDGATYEIGLAYGTITTGGVVSLTDERIFLTFNMRLNANSQGRATIQDGFFDAATVLAKFSTDSFTNAVLLQVIKDGAFQADAATRALFADKFVTRAKLSDGSACSVIGRSANSSGAVADIAASSNGAVLRRAADSLGFGQIGADSLESGINAQPKAFNADSVDGLHAADIMAGGVIQGAIIMWSGTLGGSDGHRPIVGGVANEDWHLCNGEVVGSVPTPDLRDRFVVGAGSTYTKGATGGATTASHAHGVGTLVAANEGSHKHPILSVVASVTTGGTGIPAPPLYTEEGAAHTHTLSGNVASAAPSILPPYMGLYYIMKIA